MSVYESVTTFDTLQILEEGVTFYSEAKDLTDDPELAMWFEKMLAVREGSIDRLKAAAVRLQEEALRNSQYPGWMYARTGSLQINLCGTELSSVKQNYSTALSELKHRQIEEAINALIAVETTVENIVHDAASREENPNLKSTLRDLCPRLHRCVEQIQRH